MVRNTHGSRGAIARACSAVWQGDPSSSLSEKSRRKWAVYGEAGVEPRPAEGEGVDEDLTPGGGAASVSGGLLVPLRGFRSAYRNRFIWTASAGSE